MSELNPTFMGCPNIIDDRSDFVIVGIPYDGGTTQDRGLTAKGPLIVRKLSEELAYSTENGYDLNNIRFGDLGDITLSDDYQKLISKTSAKFRKIFIENPNIIPIIIGGNHNISFASFSSVAEHYRDETVIFISFDAHLDFYDEWNGNKEAHCTVAKRIFDLEYMDENSVFIIGARDIDLPEISISKESGLKYTTMLEYSKSNMEFVKFIQNFFSKGLKNFSEKKSKIKAYISIDIDVLDPSVAPATGYPIPGGLQYRDLYFGIEYLCKIFDVVCLDLVEFAPNLNMKNNMTGFLCAKLISESIAHIKINKQ